VCESGVRVRGRVACCVCAWRASVRVCMLLAAREGVRREDWRSDGFVLPILWACSCSFCVLLTPFICLYYQISIW
jgi:hypothetical protein